MKEIKRKITKKYLNVAYNFGFKYIGIDEEGIKLFRTNHFKRNGYYCCEKQHYDTSAEKLVTLFIYLKDETMENEVKKVMEYLKSDFVSISSLIEIKEIKVEYYDLSQLKEIFHYSENNVFKEIISLNDFDDLRGTAFHIGDLLTGMRYNYPKMDDYVIAVKTMHWHEYHTDLYYYDWCEIQILANLEKMKGEIK